MTVLSIVRASRPAMSSFFCLGLMVIAASARGAAETSTPPAAVVFFDAVPNDNQDVTVTDPDAKSSISFSYDDISGKGVDCSMVKADDDVALEQIWSLLECSAGGSLDGFSDRKQPKPPNFYDLEQRAKAAAALARNVRKLTESSSTRVISAKGSRIMLVVIQRAAETRADVTYRITAPNGDTSSQTIKGVPLAIEGRQPKLTVKEEARDSTFAANLDVLAKVVARIAGAAPVAGFVGEMREPTAAEPVQPLPVTWTSIREHVLKLQRATVTITESTPADAAAGRLATGTDIEAELKKIDELLKVRAAEQAFQNSLKSTKEQSEQLQQLDCSKLDSFQRLVPLYVVACQLREAKGSPPLAVAAAKGLGELGSKAAIGVLNEAVQDPDRSVRAAAIEAIAKLGRAPDSTPAASAQRGGSAQSADAAHTATLAVLTGPQEHWFISADVLAINKDIVTTDASGAVSIAKPPTFYVAVDYLLGDIPSTGRGLGNLVVKVLIKASKNPQDSVGVGLGVRGSYLKKYGLDFEVFSPFIAWTWTRVETANGTSSREGQTRFGLSVNLGKALDWLK